MLLNHLKSVKDMIASVTMSSRKMMLWSGLFWIIDLMLRTMKDEEDGLLTTSI